MPAFGLRTLVFAVETQEVKLILISLLNVFLVRNIVSLASSGFLFFTHLLIHNKTTFRE